jgi:hypothetical protein
MLPILDQGQQESEGVPIAGNGLRAGIAMAHEPFREEGLQ